MESSLDDLQLIDDGIAYQGCIRGDDRAIVRWTRAIMTYFEGKDLEIIESLKIKQDAVPAYEMLKDCLVWTDERVKKMSCEGYEKLMDLWIVRGFIHKGTPEKKWGIDGDTYLLNAWNEAKSQVPYWIGFTRLKLSDKDRKYFEDERSKILEERGDY